MYIAFPLLLIQSQTKGLMMTPTQGHMLLHPLHFLIKLKQ